MSKRLNKRQLREIEELEALKAAQASESRSAPEDEEEQEEEKEQSTVTNPFAALEGGDEPSEEEDDEDAAAAPVTVSKKKKKNKKKKKKATAAVADDDGFDSPAPSVATSKGGKKKKGGSRADTPAPAPEDDMDEVDRALAELKLKYGEDQPPAAGGSKAESKDSGSVMAFRNLLSVDPKNLDAEAELRRFFGSKVIASAAPSGPHRHRANVLSKIRYTLAKPKPQYPPPTSLAGLDMREMTEEEVVELYHRRGLERTDKGEKWYTFSHSPAWREIERQFLGAVGSHDPNELMALLQVYPWHVDTLLQMSEVYRLQSDLGAASDYAERALYAFDRCLTPGFNVSSGSCRLDFDLIENRPMFTALHRIISYLGRRGCWVTAFNFGKLLFALDPEGDPHGAALWLDFLAVKANNSQWLLDMLEQRENSRAIALWGGYPGMAYAKALALRAVEDSRKDKEHKESTAALERAIKTFPEVVLLLADKLGANVPAEMRTNPLFHTEAGYTQSPTILLHLLAHIYVARSEPLWKEPKVLDWFEKTAAATVSSIDDAAARTWRAEAHAVAQTPRDMDEDEDLEVPLNICRHVLCSESTSWLGFLPPPITNMPFHAYDPLPPSTAVTAYDHEYFDPIARLRRSGASAGLADPRSPAINQLLAVVRGMIGQDPAQWEPLMQEAFREFTGGRDPADLPLAQRAAMVRALVRNWEETVNAVQRDGLGQNGGMPGAFPP